MSEVGKIHTYSKKLPWGYVFGELVLSRLTLQISQQKWEFLIFINFFFSFLSQPEVTFRASFQVYFHLQMKYIW